MMKSPEELAKKLAKQWSNANLREARMLHGENLPIRLRIGNPGSALVRDDISALRQHLDKWRNVSIGEVLTKPTSYRSLGQAIDLPTHWEIFSTEEWVKACSSSQIQKEYEMLQEVLRGVNPAFHSYLVRRRSVWGDQSPKELMKVAKLVDQLEPKMAGGAPLRTISLAGIDTKFIEKNRHLIVSLLDIRYDGKVSELGLEAFLGAWHDKDHWVLVSDLNNQILPFSQQRVRTSELSKLELVKFSRVVIVENEKCLQLLPPMASTIAVLGCGLDLRWMEEPWLKPRHVAYWGDLDTWGLVMLAQARSLVPTLTPLLMTHDVFSEYGSEKAVQEPTPASELPSGGLAEDEQSLYSHLLQQERGRLEQEFLPVSAVHEAFQKWMELRGCEFE